MRDGPTRYTQDYERNVAERLRTHLRLRDWFLVIYNYLSLMSTRNSSAVQGVLNSFGVLRAKG